MANNAFFTYIHGSICSLTIYWTSSKCYSEFHHLEPPLLICFSLISFMPIYFKWLHADRIFKLHYFYNISISTNFSFNTTLLYNLYRFSKLSCGRVQIIGRMRTPVRDPFSYGIRHGIRTVYSLWFNEVWPYASLNHNEYAVSRMKMPPVRDYASSLLSSADRAQVKYQTGEPRRPGSPTMSWFPSTYNITSAIIFRAQQE